MLRPRLTEVRETFTRGGPRVKVRERYLKVGDQTTPRLPSPSSPFLPPSFVSFPSFSLPLPLPLPPFTPSPSLPPFTPSFSSSLPFTFPPVPLPPFHSCRSRPPLMQLVDLGKRC